MMKEILSIKDSAQEEINNTDNLNAVQNIRIKYLGKKGILTEEMNALSAIAKEGRREFGRILNETKDYIENLLIRKEALFKAAELDNILKTQRIDVTVPGCFTPFGHLHPTTKVLDEIIEIFLSMGFKIEEGPEVEFDYYNFEALNFPKNHPARDMQDTFYISDDVVLRTHTSSVQVRIMEKNAPPLRVIAPGKVYRCDADVTHIPMFHQLEGFMVAHKIKINDFN